MKTNNSWSGLKLADKLFIIAVAGLGLLAVFVMGNIFVV